jgi:hypothetical protein
MLAWSLNFLQSEFGMYMGYLLLTLYSSKKKYSVLEQVFTILFTNCNLH